MLKKKLTMIYGKIRDIRYRIKLLHEIYLHEKLLAITNGASVSEAIRLKTVNATTNMLIGARNALFLKNDQSSSEFVSILELNNRIEKTPSIVSCQHGTGETLLYSLKSFMF